MPELPELDIVCEVLERRAIGREIAGVEIVQPGGAIVVRDLALAAAGLLTTAAVGRCVESVKRRGKVRGAKLYYLRGLEGKAARIQEDLSKSGGAD